MKIFTMVFLFITLVSNAHASGGNIQILKAEDGMGTVTAEYFWSHENLSGFGFYEMFDKGSLTYLTIHTVDYTTPIPNVFLSGEASGSNFGDSQKVGVGVRLGGAPILQKVFVFTDVTYYPQVWGKDAEQVKITWKTVRVSLSEKIGVYSSGFARIKNGASNVAQPQMWFTFGKSNLEVGSEIAISGEKTNGQLAIKYNF